MKKFNFELSSLLKYRNEVEQLRKKQLFLAQTDLHNAFDHLRKYEKELERLRQEFNTHNQEFIILSDVTAYFSYSQLLKSKMDQQKKEIQRYQQIFETKRQAAIQAMQKRKIVENLQEKQYAAWEHDYLENEKSFFDELATIRFMRSKIKE